MTSETLKLVQALNDFDGPTNIGEIVARSGLSQGKVLGNLPKLCLAGIVDKRGKLYVLTKRGKAILEELEPVPGAKGFYFCYKEGDYTGQVVYSLKDFYQTVQKIDVTSLEFHLHREDFEKWVREVLHDDELANDITGLRGSNISGEPLRMKLSEIIGRNYKMLNMLAT